MGVYIPLLFTAILDYLEWSFWTTCTKLNPSQGLCIFQCLWNPPSPDLHGLFLNLFNSLLRSFFQNMVVLAERGLHFRAGFFWLGEQGLLPVAVHRPLAAVASLVAELKL